MKALCVALTALALFLGASLVVPDRAVAQLDHLMCYKVTDNVFKGSMVLPSMDMMAEAQPEFTRKGCTIVRPVEFCVPATKTNVQPAPPLPGVVTPPQPLQHDYICYLVKCAKPTAAAPQLAIPNHVVEDQFGHRLQRHYIPFKVCVPARKAEQPCGPTRTTVGAGTCGGTCDNGERCRFDSTMNPPCTCSPPTPPCADSKPDAAGQCSATDCPTGMTCQLISTGTTKSCQCAPPPPPGCDGSDPDANGVCGGSCPPNSQCIGPVPSTGKCQCQPIDSGCVPGAVVGECGGACTDVALQCLFDTLTQQCRCGLPPAPCGPNPVTGACNDGTCTIAGTTCKFVQAPGTSGSCQCQ